MADGQSSLLNFRPLIDALNRDLYQNNPDKLDRAFVHWAMGETLAPLGLEREELRENTLIGGSGDCGVDGWHLDTEETPPSLYLFQGKYWKQDEAVSEDDVQGLWDSVDKNLLNRERNKNQYAEELATTIESLLTTSEEPFKLKLHFVSTASLLPSARARLDILSERETYQIYRADRVYNIPVEFTFWDEPKLVDLYAGHLYARGGRTTTDHIEFVVAGGTPFIRVEENPARPVTYLCLLRASEIADIFRGPPKRWDLFVENPRGPLQKYSERILRTLRNSERRSKFHALNNGLSIVCSAMNMDEDGNAATLHNMRIVNGCQTTVTLDKARELGFLDASVLVPVRITVTTDQHLRQLISDANNQQQKVKPADLAYLRTELPHYHRLFASLAARCYFEVQAGQWRYVMNEDDRARYPGGLIERQSLAQSVLAIRGKPSEALEDARSIFAVREGEDGDPHGHFEEVFGSGIPVEQMLLAWLILKKVEEQLEQSATRAKEGNPRPQDDPSVTRYSYLHRMWLIGDLLGRHYRLNLAEEIFSSAIARRLCDTIDGWFEALYEPVDEAIWRTMDRLKSDLPKVEARNLFRQSHHTFKRRVDSQFSEILPKARFLQELEVAAGRRITAEAIATNLPRIRQTQRSGGA